jgi:CRISPR/Cas system-associated exonuclease Cas4 (RecB family)
MRGFREQKGSGSGMVTASEIAAFVYCPEAWRLEKRLGLEPENREALAAGDRHHARKAMAERIAAGFPMAQQVA